MELSTTVSGKTVNITELVHFFGQTVVCIRESGVIAGRTGGASSRGRMARFTKGSGSTANTTGGANSRLQTGKSLRALSKTGSSSAEN